MCLKRLALVLLLFVGASGSDAACSTYGDEVSQLQLSPSPGGTHQHHARQHHAHQQPCKERASILTSFLAQHASLTIESGKGRTSGGTLTLSGKSVGMARQFTDRPLRFSAEIPTSQFVGSFKMSFSKKSGGHPNAVLAGRLAESSKSSTEDDLVQVTVVLQSVTYEAEKLVFEWKADDDTIQQSLELTSASLFIDSAIWNAYEDIRHPEVYVKHEICIEVVKQILNKGATSVACVDEDLEGLGICAAVDVEDAEILTPFCEAAVVGVCQAVVVYVSEEVTKKLTSGAVTKQTVCDHLGYPLPR